MKNKRIKDIEIISKGSYYNLIYTDRSSALLQLGKDRLVIPCDKGSQVVGYNFDGIDLCSNNIKAILLNLGYPVIM